MKENPDGTVVFESVACPGSNIGIQSGSQYVMGLSINLVVCTCVCMCAYVCKYIILNYLKYMHSMLLDVRV